MSKYLIVGGTHGNEPLGIEVCKRLKKMSLPYLDILFANEQAIKLNKRFVEEDLNRIFPGKIKGSYESRRAKEIIKICKGYDFVIDFHNTNCPDNDCGFVGGNNYKQTVQLGSYLGLGRIIVADYDCINKYINGCLSVEISLNRKKFEVDYWVKKMISLKDFDPRKKYEDPILYKFSYRITRKQQDKFGFPKWKAFAKIKKSDLRPLNLKGDFYPIFVDDKYTPYNYAGLIEKLI